MVHAPSAAAVLVAAGAVAVLACTKSTDPCGSGSAPALSGNYALVSYTVGTTTIPAPPAVGDLHFTATKYNVNLSLPPSTVIADSGFYTVTGARCISENSQTGQPQFTGTYSLTGTSSGSTLTVTGTVSGQSVGSAWTKQ